MEPEPPTDDVDITPHFALYVGLRRNLGKS